MHGDEDGACRDSRCDSCLDIYLAAPRNYCYNVTFLDIELLDVCLANLDVGLTCMFLYGFHFPRHGTCVVLIKIPAGGKNIWILLICALRGLYIWREGEGGLASGKSAFIKVFGTRMFF